MKRLNKVALACMRKLLITLNNMLKHRTQSGSSHIQTTPLFVQVLENQDSCFAHRYDRGSQNDRLHALTVSSAVTRGLHASSPLVFSIIRSYNDRKAELD